MKNDMEVIMTIQMNGGAAKNRVWAGFIGICPKFEKKKRSLIAA